MLLLPVIVSAQAISPGSIITDRPSAEPLPLPDYSLEKEDSAFTLPPASNKLEKKQLNRGAEIIVNEFQFSGNSVFSKEQLKAIARDYIERPINSAELEQLRHRLTQHYISHGYINSGAILPKQVFKEGIIQFQMIEGELTQIRVSGTGWLNPDYVSQRLMQGAGPPLNNKTLQDSYQLMIADPLIESMDGRLLPGLEPGQSILDVKVTRARSYQLSLSYDNYRPPSIGAEAVTLDGWIRNVTGFGDFMAVSLSHSEGRVGIDTHFSIPINAYDTVLAFHFADNRSSVIEQPLDKVNIDNEFRSFELGLTHPVYRSLQRDIILGAKIAVRKSRNSLLGRPFSFSLGEENGESKVSVLRLSQEFIDRRDYQVLSFRSTFSVGLKAFDATWHKGNRPDGDFFAWLGQLQYARQLLDNGAQIRLRGDLQLSEDKLLPLERFAVGGKYSVRGYRENEVVRDQGYALSLEFHYPLLTNSLLEYFPGQLSAIPFMDYGAAWNQHDSKHTRYLHSLGIGLSWQHQRFNAEIFYAHDLNSATERLDDNLQDSGIHFRVTAYAF